MTYALASARHGEVRRLERWALGIGVVASVVCAVGAWFDLSAFLRAYLITYLFFLGIAHGCFAIVMVYHLTGGAWGFLVRNILEAGMRTLPVFVVFFLPIILGLVGIQGSYLYLWADPAEVAASKELQHKEVYLNVPFFIVRAGLYFILWLSVVYFLNRWSQAQERTGDPAYARWLTKLSGPGLVIYGITMFFASTDWIMSIQPAYRSTITGPLFASGELLTGLAGALIVMAWLVVRPPLAEAVSRDALNDLGSLLFTFLVIWAYMTFFQFMLIWMANLRYDVMWYVPHAELGWKLLDWALVILHFAVPFFLLLMRDIKRNPRLLAAIAGLILFMHLVYLYCNMMPIFPPEALAAHWIDFVAPIAMGGLWLAYFLRDLGRHPMLPAHDANQESAVHFHARGVERAAGTPEVSHG